MPRLHQVDPRRLTSLQVEPSTAKSSRGFTMIEVLVVVVVIGVLAGVVVPQFLSTRNRASAASAVSDAREIGSLVEDRWGQNRAYPADLAAVTADVTDIKLSSNNEIVRYVATQGGFALCVIHRDASNTPTAYAVYNSQQGGVTAKGSGAGGADCDPTNTAPAGPTPPTPTTTPPPPPPPTEEPEPAALVAPENVSVAAPPGQGNATVNWTAVPGATGYVVYLDGSTTPAWTGTGITGAVSGIAVGPHDVTVATVKGADKSAPSSAVVFTIYGDNDVLANAHPIQAGGPDQIWHSADANNSSATTEAGEAGNTAYSMWWSFTAPRSATYTVSVVPNSVGAPLPSETALTIYRSTATVPSGLGALFRSNKAALSKVILSGVSGTTYVVRVSAASQTPSLSGPFRLRVATGPANDTLADAVVVPGLGAPETNWLSSDVTNANAGVETGETGSATANGMWWTFTAGRSATYTVTLAPNTLASPMPSSSVLWVWESASTNPASLGSTYWTGSGALPVVVFDANAGQTYKIRSSTTSTVTDYTGRFRLSITSGPAYDALPDAASITAPFTTAGDTWTSLNLNNSTAGGERGDTGGHSMWFTFTVPRTALYTTSIVPSSFGDPIPADISVVAYKTTSTYATTVVTENAYHGIGTPTVWPSNLVAGDTFKIRVGIDNGSPGGPFRLQIRATN